MKRIRRAVEAVLTAGAAITAAIGFAAPASAAPDPVLASPYLYQWGNVPSATGVMSATGIKSFTLAFVLSDGTCNPKWDGNRPLDGADASLINGIRGAGGDVIPSFGGWSGNKLGQFCSSPNDLAGAYQKVISAYSLKAIDIDIEDQEFENEAVQDRVLGALKIVKQNNPGLRVVITMPTGTGGPNWWGQRLIQQANALGAGIDVWSVMPFHFGSGGDMAALTQSAWTA
jgi:chitinase